MKIKIVQRLTALNHIYKYVKTEIPNCDISLGLYNNFLQELIFTDDDSDLVIIVESSIQLLKTREKFTKEVDKFLTELGQVFIKYPNKQFIVTTLEELSVSTQYDEIIINANHKMSSLVMKHNNSIICDVNFLKKKAGFSRVEDYKLIDQVAYNGSIQFQKSIANEIINIINLAMNEEKKLIVSDLDNTFWKGVIGDEGFENLRLNDTITKYYHLYLSNAKKQGKFVACVSKNSPNLLNDKHVKELLDNYFIEQELSWEEKSIAIKKLAKKFNIGLNSIVFIDDNPSEIAEVSANCPGVECLLYNHSEEFITKLHNKHFTSSFRYTITDKNRVNNYLIDRKIKSELKNDISYEDYIKSINPTISIKELNEQNITRAVQLLNKTNQFNNYKQTFTQEQINSLNKTYTIKVVDYKDIHVNERGISVVIYHEYDDEILIRNWAMSCRVFKKTVEDEILKYLNKTGKSVKLQFKQSEKNHVMKELLGDKVKLVEVKSSER